MNYANKVEYDENTCYNEDDLYYVFNFLKIRNYQSKAVSTVHFRCIDIPIEKIN